MIRTTLLVVTIASLSLVGCKDKDGGGTSSAKATESKGPTKLPKVGLQADIPGEEVMVMDGMSADSHMINSVVMGGMSVEILAEPQTLDLVKADTEMFNPKNLKTETLPDGFLVTFENTGSMGTNHWVDVRRTIGGKHVKCTTTSDTTAKASLVVAACKSLRP